MPHVVITAAMATPSGFYRPLVEAFSEHGCSAEAVASRGFDRGLPQASRHVDWGYADAIADLEAVIGAARAKHDEVLVLGHSLGAQVAAGVQLGSHAADGFVAIGASNPHFRNFPHGGIGILTLGVTIPPVSRLVGFVPKPWFGAPGAATLMREWAGFVRTGVPPFPADESIKTPTLVVHLQGDRFAVSRSNKAFCRLIDDTALTRWVYTKDIVPHLGSTDHMKWVKTPDVVVDKILRWWHEQH